MDQWLALLILGDLDPYTPPITPRVSLPTRSTKSRIGMARGHPDRTGVTPRRPNYAPRASKRPDKIESLCDGNVALSSWRPVLRRTIIPGPL